MTNEEIKQIILNNNSYRVAVLDGYEIFSHLVMDGKIDDTVSYQQVENIADQINKDYWE